MEMFIDCPLPGKVAQPPVLPSTGGLGFARAFTASPAGLHPATLCGFISATPFFEWRTLDTKPLSRAYVWSSD